MKRQAGKRRSLVTFEKPPSTEQDSAGQPLIEWTAITTQWSKVEPLTGREYFGAAQTIAEVKTRITTDFIPGLNTTVRAKCDGVVYNILDVIDFELRHVTHVLMCGSGVVADD